MKLSASSLAAVELCPARAHLPQYPETHEDAAAGTEAHAAFEQDANEKGELTEQVFALNIVTGEAVALKSDGHRNYPDLGDEWLFGTADLVRYEPGRVVIIDHKTGYGFNVDPAKTNLQLAFYAIAAAQVAGVQAARVEIQHANGYLDAADLDAIELDIALARIHALWQTARDSEALGSIVRPGEKQCWRCPCFAGCPAKTQLALTLAEGVDARELPTLELTPEAVAKGWKRLKEIKQVLAQIEGAYRGFASEVPVQLGSGKVLGIVEKSRESLDGKVTFEVLKAAYSEAVALEACELEASKTSVERALKKVVPKGKGAAAQREALAAIAAANGVSTKTSQSVEEH